MKTTMQAGYKCSQCRADHFVWVREREEREDIVNYINHVARIAGEHHTEHYPTCPCRNLTVGIKTTRNGFGVDGPELTDREYAELRASSE